MTDRALAAYGVNGAADPQPDPENGTVLLQVTTDNSFRCGSIQELIWHTAAGNTGYEYQFSRTVHGQEALALRMPPKFRLSSARCRCGR